MNSENSERKELSVFLTENRQYWAVLEIFSMNHGFVLPGRPNVVLDAILSSHKHPQKFWRIYAYEARDFAIRPPNPATIEGGPPMKFSIDDPRLADPKLQLIPGGDGEVNHPPKRYQLLELDQSWVIAVRFEIEPLAQTKKAEANKP